MKRLSRAPLARPPAPATILERRIAQVMDVAGRFVHDLGMMLSGLDDGFNAYVEDDALVALRTAVRPFLTGDIVLRPDFGDFAQLIIEGNLTDVSSRVTVHVDFENRSSAQHSDGTLVAMRRRPLRLTLVTDPDIRRVLAHRLESR